MKTIYRKESMVTGCSMEELFSLEKFPVYMMADGNCSNNHVCNMKFEIGKEDGFVQLAYVIPPEILYKDTHSNAIGAVWEGAHRLVAEKVKSYSDSSTRILEIGGATGKLNAIFNSLEGKACQWDIIETQPCPVKNCTANYIKGIFPDALEGNVKYDIILHTHCMEHMQDMHLFFKNIIKHLIPSGAMIFSVPDMQGMIEKRMTSIVNFEHTILLTEVYIDYLLGRYGFQIRQKEKYGNGHSLIYVTSYTGKYQTVSLDGLYDKNKAFMEKFYAGHMGQMKLWNDRLQEDTRPCYLFGAHITTQFFAAFGLDMNRIQALLDNDNKKIGSHVCGIDKEIYSPDILKNRGSVIVIVPASPYAGEIKKDITDNINPEVEFWMME